MSKVSWKHIFCGNTSFAGLQLIVFENKRTFMKKAVLHTTTQVHCKARHSLWDLFSTNRGNY